MVERDNELKGTTFTISVLHLSDGNPARIRQLLEAKVAQAPQFFNCAPLVLNVERLEAIPDFEQLRELVESEDFVLVGITGARDEAMKTAAKAAGLAVMVSGKSRKAEPEPTPPVSEPKQVEAHRFLRCQRPWRQARSTWARCAPVSRSMQPAPRWWCWAR